MSCCKRFLNDETGFIVSAELVLVSTLLVLGMIVGMSQVQNAVVSELNDVAHAVGAMNQTYYFSGFHARKWLGWTKSRTTGSAFIDLLDVCDGWGCSIACDGAYAEGGYCGGFGAGFGGCSSYGGWGTTSGTACGVCSASCGTTCAP